MVVWMAAGHAGSDPFKTNVNAPGILTHGHLAKTTTTAGRRPTEAHVDETKLPSRMVPNGT